MFECHLVEDPIFLCKLNLRELVSSFIDSLENLATQSKTQMKMKFQQVETIIRSKLAQILEILDQCRTHRIDIEEDCLKNDCGKVSTHCLQMQKSQLFDMRDHFERYCITLPIFGFNTAKYEISLVNALIYPFLFLNERLSQFL